MGPNLPKDLFTWVNSLYMTKRRLGSVQSLEPSKEKEREHPKVENYQAYRAWHRTS